MKFLTRRRKAAPAIIIISLIDVLVVLMVFLMVTTRFKNTPSVALTLPETREAPKAGASAEKPPMVVTIAAAAPQFYVGPRAVTSDKLLNELKDAVAADPKVKVVLRLMKTPTGATWSKSWTSPNRLRFRTSAPSPVRPVGSEVGSAGPRLRSQGSSWGEDRLLRCAGWRV